MPAFLDRTRIDPQVCHGQACVRGRESCSGSSARALRTANGNSVDENLAAYPCLSRDDVHACPAYAAQLTRERVNPIEVMP